MTRRDICNPEPIPYQTHTPRLVKIYQDKMLTHKHFPKTIKIIKTSIKTGTLCVCDKDWGGGSTWGRTGGCGVSKRRYLGVRKDYPLCSSVIFHTSHWCKIMEYHQQIKWVSEVIMSINIIYNIVSLVWLIVSPLNYIEITLVAYRSLFVKF